MKKSVVFFLLFTWTSFLNSFASDEKRLSLENCIQLSLEHSLDIKIEKIQPKISYESIRGAWGDFDALYEIQARMGETQKPLSSSQSIAAGGLVNIESDDIQYEMSLLGKIPTGTEYQLFWNQLETQSTFTAFESEFSGQLGLTLRQPLLKDAWFSNNLTFIRVARKTHQISEQEFSLNTTEILRKVMKRYWDLVLATKIVHLREESLKLSRSLLDDNRKRVEAGLISALEVTQSEAGVSARKEDLIKANRDFLNQQNLLKYLIGLDYQQWLHSTLIVVDSPQTRETPFIKDVLIELAIQNRIEYKKALINIEKTQLLLRYTKNQLFPRIDLEASFIANGLDDSFSRLNSELADFENLDWSVGFRVKMPLGRFKEKENYQIQVLQKAETLLRLKKIEQTIALEVDRAVNDIVSLKESIMAAKSSTRLADAALHAEEKKYEAGLSTSHDVLDFQEKRQQARIRLIQAHCDYEKAFVELLFARGQLLEFLGIQVTSASIDKNSVST